MFSFTGVGIQVIIAWFGTFLVNVVLAQAAFQMALSCKTPEEGQKGLIYAGFMAIPFIICGTLIGLAAAIVDRKSTRLNSSHVAISYAVFCLKKKTNVY